MSVLYSRASTQYSENATSGLSSALPITISAWGYANTIVAGSIYVLASSNNVSGSFHKIALRINTNGLVQTLHQGASTASIAATGAVPTGQWFHAAGVVAANNSRSAYFNGGGKASNTTNVSSTTAPNRTIVGAQYSGVYENAFDGYIAEVGIWNVALTDNEVSVLAKGFSPRQIRPQSLIFYTPLRGELIDIEGGRTLTTNTGVNSTQHPRSYP